MQASIARTAQRAVQGLHMALPEPIRYVTTLQGFLVLIVAIGCGIAAGKGFGLLACLAILQLAVLGQVITKPIWGVVLWITVAPLTQTYLDSGSLLRFLANALHMWWVPTMLVLVFFSRMVRKQGMKPMGLTEYAIIAFTLYASASLAYTIGELQLGDVLGLTQDVYSTIRMFYLHFVLAFMAYTIGRHLICDERNAKIFTLACIVMVCYLGPIAFMEHKTGSSMWTGILLWRDMGRGRVAGPFSNPVIFGVVIGAGWLFAMHGLLQFKSRWRLAMVPLLYIAALTIYWTYTRSVWVSIPVCALVVFILYPSLRRYMLIGLGFMVMFGALMWPRITSSQTVQNRLLSKTSVVERGMIATLGLHMFLESPFVGHGQGTYDLYNREAADKIGVPIGSLLIRRGARVTTSHNSYVTLLVELGVVGFVLYVMIFVGVVLRAFLLFRYLPSNQFFGRELFGIAIGAIVVYVANAMFLEMRFYSFSDCVMMLCLGIAQAVLDSVDPEVQRREAADRRAFAEVPLS